MREELPTPSPPSSSAPSSQTPATATTQPVEPYDSPLKERPREGEAGYAGGGRETDFEGEDDGGDLGGARIAGYRDKGKGKARASDQSEYGRLRTDDRSPELQVDEPEVEEVVDEEAEARRIQENLARWSRADMKKRADVRRSSTLVYPSLPSPPPIPIPSASSIVRRTSTLIRAGTRRKASRDVGGLDAEEMELGRTGGSVPPAVDVAGRRGRRKLSVVIGTGADGEGEGVGSLKRVGEEGEERDPALTPTGPSQQLSLRTPTSATSPPLSNPFSPAGVSTVSLASTSTTTTRSAKTASRFIEDLPPLPISPPLDAPTSNPFGTPTTPTGGGRLPFSSRSPNPFADVIVTTPSTSSASHLSQPQSHRPGFSSRPSQQSFADTFASSAPPSRRSSIAPPSRSPSPSSGLSPGGLARRRRPSSTASTPTLRADEEYRRAAGRRRDFASDADRDEQRSRGKIGLLDWLMCGCWRVGGYDDEEGAEQQGRTNPNE